MMQQHYTFGGNTGRTYQELQRQRYLAQNLAGPPVMPKTFGQGLSALGHAFAQHLVARRMARAQAQGREQANAQFEALFGGGQGHPPTSTETTGGAWRQTASPTDATGNGFGQSTPPTARGMGGGFGQPAPTPGAASGGFGNGGFASSGARNAYGRQTNAAKPVHIDPRLLHILENPFATNGQKAFAMLLTQRVLKNSVPPDPMKQMQLQEERLKLERMRHPPRETITGADGYNYYQNTGERVLPNVERQSERRTIKGADGYLYYQDDGSRVLPNVKQPEDTGYRMLTPDQTQRLGLPEGAYQQGPKGRISQIGDNGTDVTINDQAETQLQKERGKGLAGRLNGIAEDGMKALDDLTTINRLGGLLKGVDTGGLLGPGLTNAISQMTGIGIGSNISKHQAIQALVDYMTPRMRVKGSGQSSDKDIEIFKNALPGLMKTSEGNRIIVETLGGMAQRRADLGDIAFQWQLGEISAAEAYKRMRELPDPFKAFSERAGNANGPVPYEVYFKDVPGN
ncbi:MAG: hypothetical protein V6Z86_10055 [Hyphomicrobiales bacterium]